MKKTRSRASTPIGGRKVKYPPEQKALPPGATLGSGEGYRFIRTMLDRLSTHLKWPVTEEWKDALASFMNALYPQVTWPLQVGAVYRTRFGVVRVVDELEHEQCPVYGKAVRNLLPYEITVAARAGRHRAALALVHELLHAADYHVGTPLDHTLLHNIAGIVESEILQKMKGYNA